MSQMLFLLQQLQKIEQRYRTVRDRGEVVSTIPLMTIQVPSNKCFSYDLCCLFSLLTFSNFLISDYANYKVLGWLGATEQLLFDVILICLI